jgi:hypothetical protein
MLHERPHRRALVAKEVVTYRVRAWSMALRKSRWSGALDEIVDEWFGIADVALLRYRPARNSSRSSPRSVNPRRMPALLGFGCGR